MSSEEFTVNWNRCVHVTGRIGDDLVEQLTPQILQLRQLSNSPITVAINSFGGSVSAIDPLLGLITSPDQDGRRCTAITVVTHQAFSAAASLLAFGNYAVAMEHSSILLHDLRYGGMEDVTPDKARNAARQLQSANETFALRLANVVFRRLTWVYIDVRAGFGKLRENNSTYERYKTVVNFCGVSPTKAVEIDIAALAATIHRYLSPANRGLLDNAMNNLQSWAATTGSADVIPMYRVEQGPAGLLDGALDLYKALKKPTEDQHAFGVPNRAEELRLFMVLAMAQFATKKGRTATALELALADFTLMESINDPSHMDTAARLMLRHSAAFFTFEAAAVLEGKDAGAKAAVMGQVQPYVKVMWHLCVLLCRELVTGDHTLTPREALMLGIIDDVPGDSTLESRRAFRIKMEAQQAKLPSPVPRRLRRRAR